MSRDAELRSFSYFFDLCAFVAIHDANLIAFAAGIIFSFVCYKLRRRSPAALTD